VTGAIAIAQLEALAGLEQVKSVTKASKETAVVITPSINAELPAGALVT
jgi:hypothetical protein